MISWLSNLIQKRGKIIFSVLLAIIIVAFVFTIGAGPGIVSKDQSIFQRDFYGIDLNSPEQVAGLQDAAMISHYLNGMQRMGDEQFQEQMFSRQVMLYMADQLGIPEPDEAAFVAFVRELSAFTGEDGVFDPTALEGFLATIQGGGRFSQRFVDRVISEDFRIREVSNLISSQGWIIREEVVKTVAKERTVWSVDVATFSFDAFHPIIEISDEDIQKFFAENSFRYQRPEEFSASFVEFTPAIVEDTIPMPNDQELRAHYLRNTAKFSQAERDLEEKAASESEDGTPPAMDMFELLRNQILASYSDEKKALIANDKANDFVYALFERDIAYGSPEFRQLLRENGLSLKHIPPFSARKDSQLVGIVPEAIFNQVMLLDSKRYYSDVVSHQDGARHYVAFLESITPAAIPELQSIRGQVDQDFRSFRKSELFAEKGKELTSTLREALESDPASLLSTAENLGMKTQSFQEFTARDRPEDLNFRLINEIDALSQGDLSEMITVENNGHWVYVSSKVMPEISEDDPEFASMLAALEGYSGSSRYRGMILDLIQNQLKPGS